MKALQIPALLSLSVLLAPGPAPRASEIEDYYQRLVRRAVQKQAVSLEQRSDFYAPKNTWEQSFVVTSDHYRVRTIGSRAAANKLVNGLEYMLGQFQSLLDTEYVPPQRFQVDVMPIADYNARGDAAAEHSSFYGSFLESNGRVAVAYSPNSELVGILATHSASHQFIAQAFGQAMPYWVSEGLAAYFASLWNPEWSKSELSRVSNGPAWIGMRQLLGGRAADYQNDGYTRLIELGMLFKYLLHFNEATGPESDSPFVEHLREVVRGDRGDSRSYGVLGMQRFESEFRGAEY